MSEGFALFSLKTLTSGGGGGSTTGKFVGSVTNNSSAATTGVYYNAFPIKRLDGSALQDEDFVRVHTSATTPMTIAGKVFSTSKSVGYYYGGEWVVMEGILPESNEVMLKNKASESISGTSTNQSQANAEFKTEVNKKLDKATTTVSIEHAYIHKADGTDGLMQINGNANASNAIVRRQPNNQLKVPETPVANDDAVSKKYVDDHSGSKKNAYASIKQHADYLFEMQYTQENIDQEYAYNVFTSTTGDDLPSGACTGVYYNKKALRQYDWYYDNLVDFLVRVAPDEVKGKFGSVALCGALPYFTKDAVGKETYNEKYKLVPFTVIDGINEHGLFFQQNVVPKKANDISITHTSSESKGSITTNMIGRILLDNCKTVSEVAAELAKYDITRPARMPAEYDSHYLICDSTGAHKILEFTADGHGYQLVSFATNYEVMTNFNVLATNGISTDGQLTLDWNAISADSVHSAGLERWELCATEVKKTNPDIASLRSKLNYTNSYISTTDPFWFTEYCGMENEEGEILSPAMAKTDPGKFTQTVLHWQDRYNNRTREDTTEQTWQSVHSAIYDLTDKSINLVIQERDSEVYKVFYVEDGKYDSEIAKKVDRVVTEDGGARSIIDNSKGQHGAVLQSDFDDTIVSFNTADENGEDGIVGQIYAKTKSTNQGARLNIKKTGMFYGKGTSATTEADDELAVKGDIKPSTTTVTGATTMKSVKIKGVDYNLPEGGSGSVEIDNHTIVKDENDKLKTNIGGYVVDEPEDSIMLTAGDGTKTGPYTFTWATPSADIKRLYEEVAVNDIEVNIECVIDGTFEDGTVTGTASAISSNEVRWLIRFPETDEKFRLFVTYNHSTETASIEALTTADATDFYLDCKYVVEAEHTVVEPIDGRVVPINAEQFRLDSHGEICICDIINISTEEEELTDEEVEFIQAHENIVVRTQIDESDVYLQKLSVDGDVYTFVATTQIGAGGELLVLSLNTDTKAITTSSVALTSVGVSGTGTSTNEVQYITVNGTEYKLAGGGGGSVATDNQTIFKNDEGKLQAMYGGGRVVWDTPTVLELSSSMGTYNDEEFGVPIMVFGNLYAPDYWELKNRVTVSINVNGSIYSAEDKVIEKITFGSFGWFKAIRLTDFMETGSESFLTYLPDYNMTIIYTSASISSATAMIINNLKVTYDYYMYYPIEKEYMPLHPRFFSANEDGIFEPNVQIGTWAEPREIINNIGTPESYRIHEGFVYFNVDRSSEAKEENYIEINFDLTLAGLGRVRAREEGYLVKIANNQYQASLDFVSGDQHTFQIIRIFANTTPAEVQLQFVNEIPATDLEELRDVVVRQVQYDDTDHPLPSKYLKLNSSCLKVNSDGEVFIKVSAESGNKLEIKDDGLYVGE